MGDLYNDVTRNAIIIDHLYLHSDGKVYKHSDDMGPGSISEYKPTITFMKEVFRTIKNLRLDAQIAELQTKKKELNT